MIIAIVGPTGVGKTKMSIQLAKIYNGEIINNDAMQIYKKLDIGTAKATKEEMEHIPHHLLSIKEPTEDYSVYDFQMDARKCIEEIKNRGHVPIFVGGTGYYLKAALYDYDFQEDNASNDYKELSDEEIAKRIDTYDIGIPIEKNNRKRNERLLTKLENNQFSIQDDFKCLYDNVIFIGLTADRETLYKRINERFDKMLVDLIDEVKPFYLQNIRSKALMTGIGYKEFYDFFDNKETLHNTVEKIKQNSRNYAKRQYTWFNNQMNINWFEVDYQNFSSTINEVVNFIEQKK